MLVAFMLFSRTRAGYRCGEFQQSTIFRGVLSLGGNSGRVPVRCYDAEALEALIEGLPGEFHGQSTHRYQTQPPPEVAQARQLFRTDHGRSAQTRRGGEGEREVVSAQIPKANRPVSQFLVSRLPR